MGAVLQPPHCITCAKGPAPTPPPYYGLVASSGQKSQNRHWDDEWMEEDLPPEPTKPPKPKKKQKKGYFNQNKNVHFLT